MSDSQKLERIVEGLEAIAILSEQNLPVHDLAMECIRIARHSNAKTAEDLVGPIDEIL